MENRRIRCCHAPERCPGAVRTVSGSFDRYAEQGGGGIESGVAYAAVLTELTVQLSELETLGVQLKDFERGLVDFPSLRDGRVVLLCWQLGEGDELEWWHDVDAGFAGRTPL